ncbi:MAG TPA: hypothetical protein VID95_10285, partial [Candidatus Limnocylindrales bacterium]
MAATIAPRLAAIDLPRFGAPERRPEIPASRYPERIEALRRRMADRGYTLFLLFADREHSAS